MAWYYARGDERMGPVDDAAMDQLVRSGTVTTQTLVWKEGMEEWQPLGTVAKVAEPAAAATPAVPESLYGNQMMQGCAECGRSFASDDMVAYENHWVCADCKDVFFQRVREGGGVLTDLRYAGFWIRFCARFVDSMIGLLVAVATAGIVFLSALYLTGSQMEEPGVPFAIAYAAYMVMALGFPVVYDAYFVGKFAATPGKMAVGVKVVMSDGGTVRFGRSWGRAFGYVLSSMTMQIGCIIAAFDDQKRSLHDHICDTRVVFK
ncbi:MAG: RDD family protein [Candidatus Hydrogenedentes bacterium]|nr:RDD family protein [Candidatus Hydrogenedentota bacterium]